MLLSFIMIMLVIAKGTYDNGINLRVAQVTESCGEQEKEANLPKAVKIGMSMDEIESILGRPDTCFGVGPTALIMVYNAHRIEIGCMFARVSWISAK